MNRMFTIIWAAVPRKYMELRVTLAALLHGLETVDVNDGMEMHEVCHFRPSCIVRL